MKNLIYIIVVSILIFSCNNNQKKDVALNELFAIMQGSFNSSKQAEKDSTYYNISLHMYPIWKEKGKFLYVEQALNSMQNKPYRQRIYELTRLNDSIFSSAIYTIPNDSLWIGKWKNPDDFNSLNIKDISKKEGCQVLLKKLKNNHFKGETGVKTCKSTLYGASYATSIVEIKKGQIISWDRGFDSIGKHIWGAKKAGYVFDVTH